MTYDEDVSLSVYCELLLETEKQGYAAVSPSDSPPLS